MARKITSNTLIHNDSAQLRGFGLRTPTSFQNQTWKDPLAEFESQQSPQVRMGVQSKLRDLGLLKGKVDGIFGPGFRAAIRSFQKTKNLNETGYLDSLTMFYLNNEKGTHNSDKNNKTTTGQSSDDDYGTRNAMSRINRF